MSGRPSLRLRISLYVQTVDVQKRDVGDLMAMRMAS